MNKSEEIAQNILYAMGWNPKKINPTKYRNKGMPDFKCSNSKYVEVKGINKSDYNVHIKQSQIDTWKNLLYKNNKVYLMIFKNDTFYHMFKIEEV